MKYGVLALASAAAVLAGCATGDGVVIHNRYQAADYNYAALQYYNADKPSYVEVHNNPFGSAEANDRIAQLMRGKNSGRTIPFTADRNYADGDTKFVVVFNPPASLTGYRACNLDTGNAGSASNGTGGEILMSYCVNGQDKSSLRASAGSVNGLTDPTLERLLARATHDLLPENFTKKQGSGNS